MDGGPLGLLKFLAPQVPSLANTAVWHTLGRTPTSSKWDLRTELTVQVLRQMMSGGNQPRSVLKVQESTLRDGGVKGKTWVATAKVKAPKGDEEGLREAVFKAIEDMKPAESTPLKYSDPGLEDVEVEWTGFRSDAGKDDPPPDIPEEEKYKKLMAEPSRTSETTILYFHGGAYYLCDPATHRPLCSRLAKETYGRVCNVRYRLAPQTAFPGQLLDALLVYLSLLYPQPGSMHELIPAKNIVIAGDSAGGNIAFALLQLLLYLNRNSKKVVFHGRSVEVPLPAGSTANSGWFDISRSMPSIIHNSKYDYLPPANNDNPTGSLAQDQIWPASPPRGDVFCDLSLLDHPLASPLVAESWKTAPPLWMCMGQEMLRDEIAVVASQAVAKDVKVQLEEYEAMPHCFAQLLPSLPTADRCMRSWGDFCRRCVEDPAGVKTNGTFIYAKIGQEDPLGVNKITNITLQEAQTLVEETKERRVKGYEKAGKATPKSTL